ncbi:MAG: HAD family hydrolase [Patescibacteria group bacterium]|jgi:phosphoglycolate phosphatase-like HAD superfamily hydrolase
MIKNIIIDWSGVINDNTKNFYQVVLTIFRNHGIDPISFEEFRQHWQQPYMLFYNKYIPDLTHELEQKEYRSAIEKQPLPNAYPGISEILKVAKQQGKVIIILSSDFNEHIKKEILRYDLNDVFTDIYSNVHDKSLVIKQITEKYNFKLNETIFIGDTRHEVESGKSAAVQTAAVTWGIDPESKLKTARPDYIIHNIEELKSLINDN